MLDSRGVSAESLELRKGLVGFIGPTAEVQYEEEVAVADEAARVHSSRFKFPVCYRHRSNPLRINSSIVGSMLCPPPGTALLRGTTANGKMKSGRHCRTVN
jgi:hypothetical protein